MEKRHIPEVTKLLNEHLHENYKVHICFNQDECEHWLMPREKVFYSWVVEDDKGHVTDFFSFYELNSHVLHHH